MVQPSLLASIGPNIGDVILVSTQRPLLAFLLSIAGAVSPRRVFEYDDPRASLLSGDSLTLLPALKSRSATAVSLLQYLLALGAVANTIHVAYGQLAPEIKSRCSSHGVQQILARRLSYHGMSPPYTFFEPEKTLINCRACEVSLGPLLSALIPVLIHSIVAAFYMITIKKISNRVLRHDNHSNAAFRYIKARHKLPWWQREGTLCQRQPKGVQSLLDEISKDLTHVPMLLNHSASFAHLIGLIYATLMFSSLLYAAVYDVINSIFFRYLATTLLCRLIVAMEIGGMHANLDKSQTLMEEMTAEPGKERLLVKMSRGHTI